MSNTMVPRDAEALLVEYLTAKMPTYEVSTRVRSRSGVITVEQVGSTRRSPVHDYPMMTIQTWHDSEITASEMCRTAFAHIWAMPADLVYGHIVRDVGSVGGPQSFPDPEADCPRWQATVELNLRPVAL